jgi:hypothetical protein
MKKTMEITTDVAISNIEMIQTQLEITQQPRSITLDIAIATMRKYEKIEQIIDHYKNNVRDKVTNENMEKILEVIENG